MTTKRLSISTFTTETAELNLPELIGTQRQKNWANDIRINFIATIQRFDDTPNSSWDTQNFIQAVQDMLSTYIFAKYWIEKLQFGTQKQAIDKILEFYQIELKESKNQLKGLQTEIISIIKDSEDETSAWLTGSKKSGTSTIVKRKVYTNKSFPNKMLTTFDNDVYSFQFNDNVAINISWVGNYKQNIWSEEITEEQKQSVGSEEKISTKEFEKGEIVHNAFNKILACISSDIPVYLVGPAGSGKNHVLEQVAKELELDFYFTNSVQQEHKLTGFIDAGGRYHETEFYKAFVNGGLFFLDEMDASIPEVLVLLNAAIANGYFEFPNGRVDAHSEFRVVAAGNTMGSGADDQYTGRLVLDQATLDRFCIIEFDYDIRIEVKLAKGNMELVNFIHDLRKQSANLGIRATFSYRCIISATKLSGQLSVEEIVAIAIVKGIDKDTLNTYHVGETNIYANALRKIQKAS